MKKPQFKDFRKPNRKRRMTRHHNKAQSRGGTWESFNIFMLSEKHHQAYHTLFGVRNFSESAQVLLRMQEKHERGGM